MSSPELLLHNLDFRLQNNPETKLKQFEEWEAILSTRLPPTQFILSVDSPIFTNYEIKRSLCSQYRKELFDYLVSKKLAVEHGMGSVLYYKVSISEWGDRLYKWAKECGKCGLAESIFSLTCGENAFLEMPAEMIIDVLRHLEKTNKCEIILDGEIPTGVKFFS